jgi:hypothetical protein
VRELKNTRSNPTVQVFVDAKTFIPIEIRVQYGPKPWPAYPVQVTTISDYQRLPLTRSNRALLRMRPHPGARALCPGRGAGGPARPGSTVTCVTRSPRPSTATLPPLPGQLVAQINLQAPDSKRTPYGIADVYSKNKRYLIRIEARAITPTEPTTAYAVWLTGGSNKPRLLGFVNPGVRNNQHLSTEGGLPADAAQYHHVLLTLEHTQKPHHPGTVVLQGTLSL